MAHFVYKLIPPRTTFAQDITPAEAKLMQEHGAYWRGLIDKGSVLLFGPVMDPKGVWGLAVVEANNETDARSMSMRDPVITANAGFKFEIYPMQVVVRE